MSQNNEDLNLLREDPGALVLKYQQLVSTIVQLQVRAGYIKRRDKEEYVHYILDEFLGRIQHIRQLYNGKSLLRTYCATIFRNICWDRIRLESKKLEGRVFMDVDREPYGALNALQDMAIREEVVLFGKALSLFGPDEPKVSLLLKAHYRMPLDRKDIQGYAGAIPAAEADRWIRRMTEAAVLSDTDLNRVLGELMLKVEGTSRTEDAVRKWIRNRIRNLVDLMNKARDTRHTEETIEILADRFFFPLQVRDAKDRKTKRKLAG